jgi:hypothetical protein
VNECNECNHEFRGVFCSKLQCDIRSSPGSRPAAPGINIRGPNYEVPDDGSRLLNRTAITDGDRQLKVETQFSRVVPRCDEVCATERRQKIE